MHCEGEDADVEFMQFAADNGFGGAMLWYAPSIDGIAIFWLCAVPFFTLIIFCFNILYADDYGFDRMLAILDKFIAARRDAAIGSS